MYIGLTYTSSRSNGDCNCPFSQKSAEIRCSCPKADESFATRARDVYLDSHVNPASRYCESRVRRDATSSRAMLMSLRKINFSPPALVRSASCCLDRYAEKIDIQLKLICTNEQSVSRISNDVWFPRKSYSSLNHKMQVTYFRLRDFISKLTYQKVRTFSKQERSFLRTISRALAVAPMWRTRCRYRRATTKTREDRRRSR